MSFIIGYLLCWLHCWDADIQKGKEVFSRNYQIQVPYLPQSTVKTTYSESWKYGCHIRMGTKSLAWRVNESRWREGNPGSLTAGRSQAIRQIVTRPGGTSEPWWSSSVAMHFTSSLAALHTPTHSLLSSVDEKHPPHRTSFPNTRTPPWQSLKRSYFSPLYPAALRRPCQLRHHNVIAWAWTVDVLSSTVFRRIVSILDVRIVWGHVKMRIVLRWMWNVFPRDWSVVVGVVASHPSHSNSKWSELQYSIIQGKTIDSRWDRYMVRRNLSTWNIRGIQIWFSG